MADRAQPLSPIAGFGAAGFVAALLFGALGVVAGYAPESAPLGTSDWAAVRFTVLQSVLSSVISVMLAVPLARALHRRSFPGRAVLISLLGAPFLLPVIVAVMGLLSVFGRSGWINDALAGVGLPTMTIYGLHGVVLAHVFFNLPLATRLLLQGWANIPAEQFRQAAQLGFSDKDVRRHLEWPMLRRAVPGAAAIIFAICVSSFAVALTLGGGPKATTVELAIYQAFRFDFDLSKAANLGLVQLGLAIGAGLLALLLAKDGAVTGAGLGRVQERWDGKTPVARGLDSMWITLGALFLLVPMGAIVAKGGFGILDLPVAVWRSAVSSIIIAVSSAAICMTLALSIAVAAVRHRWIEGIGLVAIASSPLVIGTGLFIVLYPFVAPDTLAFPVTALVNAVMALPFALRALIPSMAETHATFARLGTSVGLSRMQFFRLVMMPRARPVLGFAGGLAAALSMGDLGVVTLFAASDQATLPLQVFRLMGAYRMGDAAAAAVLLALLSFGAFWMCDAWGRKRA